MADTLPLPPLAPVPPANIRHSIPSAEWEACLDAWILLIDLRLRRPSNRLEQQATKDNSFLGFLNVYLRELAQASQDDPLGQGPKAHRMKRLVYLLTRRYLLFLKAENEVLQDWMFLSYFCMIYSHQKTLHATLHQLWVRRASRISTSLASLKFRMNKQLSVAQPTAATVQDLRSCTFLMRFVPEAGHVMMTGSDYLDTLCSAYPNMQTEEHRRMLVAHVYMGLLCLTKGAKPNFSVLLDQLYSLRDSAEEAKKRIPGQATLLADLVTNTQLLLHVKHAVPENMRKRAENISENLKTHRTPSIERRPATKRPKPNKGKGPIENDEFGHQSLANIHVHRMSLITQIQDVFPDIGSLFITQLLDEYDESVEEVTAHLLDDSLPAHLLNLDRKADFPAHALQSSNEHASQLAPHATPPLQPRRNIHDLDDFDRLAVSPTRITQGRSRDKASTADALLQDRSMAPNKAAILSALAAFDSDDDERDDSYDVQDVGGTVDTAIPGSDEIDRKEGDENEEALFRAWKMSPDAFSRDAQTRRGKARLALKNETGMTDEAIEGWATMLGRDPRRLKRLEARFEGFGGQQRDLAHTSYRGGLSGSEDEGERSGVREGFAGGHGRGRGRGRGGGRGRVGIVAGPANEKSTQVARQRKDANKGSRANHNRREGRAKKMARGGFPG